MGEGGIEKKRGKDEESKNEKYQKNRHILKTHTHKEEQND